MFFLVLLLAGVSLLASMSKVETPNKNSSFECGFLATTKSSSSVSLQFLGILLLFLIFDLEILFLISFVIYPKSSLFFFLIFLWGSLLLESYFFSVSWKT